MKSLPVMGTLLLLSTTICASRVTAQDARISALKANTAPSTTHMVQFLGKELQRELGADKYYEHAQATPTDATRLSRSLRDIATRYRQQKEKNEIGLTIIQGNRQLIEASIAYGVILAPETAGGSLMISGLGYAANKGLAQVEEMFVEASRGDLRRNLRARLDAYSTQVSAGDYRQLLQQKSPDAFREALELRTGPLLGDALDGISEEDRGIVLQFYDREILSLMSDGFNALNEVQSAQGAELVNAQRNIVAVARSFAAFADTTTAHLNNLYRIQTEIKDELTDMTKRLANNERGIAFMTQVMFGNMSPAEQESALKQGMLGVDETTKAELLKQIALVRKREELNRTITSYLNGANAFVSIARNIGVDPHLVNIAQSVVSAGNEAFAAFTALSSGNILGGISAITGIFGGFGGRDIAAERHQEIMNALQGLYTEIGLIDQKIDLLQKGQEQLLKNQQTIYDGIVQLSQQVARNQEQLMDKLQALHGDLLYNREVVNSRVQAEYGSCRSSVTDSKTGRRIVDTQKRHYPSYQEFRDLYMDASDHLASCRIRLQRVQNGKGDFLVDFYLRTYDNQVDAGAPHARVAGYLSDVFHPALNLLESSYGPEEYRAKLASLFLPVTTVDALDHKLAVVREIDTLRFGRDTRALMQNLLSPEAVAQHANLLTDFHIYYQLLDPFDNERPTSVERLFALPNGVRRTGHDALLRARSLLEIAIAQHSLLSGDALLPAMTLLFARQDDSPSADERLRWGEFIAVLERNSVLAENFMMYSIRREVLERSNPMTYQVALGNSRPALLRTLLMLPWQLEFSDTALVEDGLLKKPKGWSAKFGEVYLALPSGEALAEGSLVYQPVVKNLYALKERVSEEITSYDVLSQLPPTRRKLFNNVLLNAIGRVN